MHELSSSYIVGMSQQAALTSRIAGRGARRWTSRAVWFTAYVYHVGV